MGAIRFQHFTQHNFAKMNIRPVLIEKEDIRTQTVSASSGALIEEKYVLATSSLLPLILQEKSDLLRQIEEGKLHLYTRKPVKFRVFWKIEDNECFVSKEAVLFGLFKCRNLKEFLKNNFKDWQGDCTNNLKEAVSVFLILIVRGQNGDEENLKACLHIWLRSISEVHISKFDKVLCISSPFGSRGFLNSLSEGIVSTVLKNAALFLSDCSSAPGSEGGLVYVKKSPNLPVGVVVSSFNWWRKEWVGFTMVADIRPIICQLTGSSLKVNQGLTLPRHLTFFENCLAQVNCGTNWGSCILLSEEKGIFLTNAHVIMDGREIRVLWKTEAANARLIHKTPEDSAFDLALIQSEARWPLMSSPNLSMVPYEIGDTVYSAGYPLLSTFSKPEGITVTKGIISACNPHTIQTTCAVYPGFSGGAVFNSSGVILGIIVSNTRLSDVGVTYPKHNMAIPFQAIKRAIFEYLRTEDPRTLALLD